MKNGGPAFPHPNTTFSSREEALNWQKEFSGMSLRDWFAGQAPSAEINDITPATVKECAEYIGISDISYRPTDYKKVLAKARYEWADAMLAARTAAPATETTEGEERTGK